MGEQGGGRGGRRRRQDVGTPASCLLQERRASEGHQEGGTRRSLLHWSPSASKSKPSSRSSSRCARNVAAAASALSHTACLLVITSPSSASSSARGRGGGWGKSGQGGAAVRMRAALGHPLAPVPAAHAPPAGLGTLRCCCAAAGLESTLLRCCALTGDRQADVGVAGVEPHDEAPHLLAHAEHALQEKEEGTGQEPNGAAVEKEGGGAGAPAACRKRQPFPTHAAQPQQAATPEQAPSAARLHALDVLPRHVGNVQQPADAGAVDADEHSKGLDAAHDAVDQRAHLY